MLADLIEKYATTISIDDFSDMPDKYPIEKNENSSMPSEKAIDKIKVV